MSWLKLIVRIPLLGPGTLDDVLSDAGAAAVTTISAEHNPVFELTPGVAPAWDGCELHALFPPDHDVAATVAAVLAADGGQRELTFDFAFVGDSDWTDAWRAHATRSCFADRLWVVPKAEDVQPADGQVVVRLDPGLAFGTGGHPTTALCLEWLAQTPPDDLRVLDFGCGSGILAVAAAKLGARDVWALDHDPQALVATRENASYNAVAERVQVVEPAALAQAEPFDVVLANVLANPLVELAPQLAAAVRPGGALILSGILPEQGETVAAAYAGFRFQRASQEGWLRLTGRRPV